MRLTIRRQFTIVEERHVEAGRPTNKPLRKVAAVCVVENPYAGKYVDDLSEMIEASGELGRKMGADALAALKPYPPESHGKGGLVGLAGEQEHANALLTTAFANPVRDLIGEAPAWVSSMTKVAAPGTPIDIPMNNKDDIYVRSHYDGMSLMLADTPQPDEIALILCLANRGRLNARVGGLTLEDALKKRKAQ